MNPLTHTLTKTKLKKFITLQIALLALTATTAQAKEIKTDHFVVCKQKRATGVYLRTIAIHKVKTKKQTEKYITIYKKNGEIEVIASGKRLSFNKKKVKELTKHLEEHLWECEKQKNVKIFYSNKKIFS